MDEIDFNHVVNDVLSRCRSILTRKGREYAGPIDRLQNFKDSARIQGCTPEQALIGMRTKHTVSVMGMVDGVSEGNSYPLSLWEEKILDEINYNILLMALIKERRDKEEEEDE